MSDFNIYIVALLGFGIVFSAISFWVFRLNEKEITKNEKVPRYIVIGLILGFLDLLWCIPHVKPILPSLSWQPYLFPAACIIIWLSYLLLDYIFSRAFAGLLILLAYYFLHASFTFHSFATPLFSLLSYAMGIVGIFIAAKPYLLRDWIRLASKSKKWKSGIAVSIASFSLLSLVVATLHLIHGRG
jgi:hypothetical protein